MTAVYCGLEVVDAALSTLSILSWLEAIPFSIGRYTGKLDVVWMKKGYLICGFVTRKGATWNHVELPHGTKDTMSRDRNVQDGRTTTAKHLKSSLKTAKEKPIFEVS